MISHEKRTEVIEMITEATDSGARQLGEPRLWLPASPYLRHPWRRTTDGL